MSATIITIHRLFSVSEVTDIVGTRIFPTVVGIEKKLPAIAVNLASEFEDYTFDGAGGLATSRVTVVSVGSDAKTADQLGEVVKDALKNFRGQISVNSKNYAAIFMKGSSDGAFHENQPNQFRRSTDFILFWR